MKSSRILGAAFTVHSSFSELMHQYDGFILDQFGVLHNGKHPLPGAVACVQELIRRKKKLVILSNTSSPSKSALSKIQKIGFEPEWFEGGAVTSGEEASSYISETYGKTRDGHQKKAIWFTYTSDKTPPPLDFLEACGDIQLADTVEQADFIIAHGSEIWLKRDQKEMKLGSFMSDGNLQCKTRNLPLICANPDFVVKVADGSTAFMPGRSPAQIWKIEFLSLTCARVGRDDSSTLREARRVLYFLWKAAGRPL